MKYRIHHLYFSLHSCFLIKYDVSEIFKLKIIHIRLIVIFDLFELLIKNSIDEFILCRYDSNNIISVLIFFRVGNFLSLLYINIFGYFR